MIAYSESIDQSNCQNKNIYTVRSIYHFCYAILFLFRLVEKLFRKLINQTVKITVSH